MEEPSAQDYDFLSPPPYYTKKRGKGKEKMVTLMVPT